MVTVSPPIDIRVSIDPVHWFLDPPSDTRSSLYLEDAATEFQVQGLELDWTIVTWDADLRWTGSDWSFHSFRGAKWTDVKKPERRQYLKNASVSEKQSPRLWSAATQLQPEQAA